MPCIKIKDCDNKVVGFICSSIQDRGKFLMWTWELHKTLGVCWWIKYPVFQWRKFKNYFKSRREHFSFWKVFKEEILFGLFWWFEITEKEILLREDNPLWSWFYFQRWYRKKFKK